MWHRIKDLVCVATFKRHVRKKRELPMLRDWNFQTFLSLKVYQIKISSSLINLSTFWWVIYVGNSFLEEVLDLQIWVKKSDFSLLKKSKRWPTPHLAYNLSSAVITQRHSFCFLAWITQSHQKSGQHRFIQHNI